MKNYKKNWKYSLREQEQLKPKQKNNCNKWKSEINTNMLYLILNNQIIK